MIQYAACQSYDAVGLEEVKMAEVQGFQYGIPVLEAFFRSGICGELRWLQMNLQNSVAATDTSPHPLEVIFPLCNIVSLLHTTYNCL